MTRLVASCIVAACVALGPAAPASAGVLDCTDAFVDRPIARGYVECVTDTGIYCLIFFDPGPGTPYPIALAGCLA